MHDQFEPFRADGLEPWEPNYAMWIHIASLISYAVAVLSSGVGFWVPIATAIVMWMVHKKDSEFLDDHGREAVNFQISILVMFLLAWPIGILMCGIGVMVTVPAVICLGVIGCILGAQAGKRGQIYRYPATIRFL